MLNTVRDELRSKYSQKPQLSSSHPMDTNLLFVSSTLPAGLTDADAGYDDRSCR